MDQVGDVVDQLGVAIGFVLILLVVALLVPATPALLRTRLLPVLRRAAVRNRGGGGPRQLGGRHRGADPRRAMEAALIGGLVAAGLDSSSAAPAVFMNRPAAFWVPILPRWFCFQWLQRHDDG